MISIQGVPAYYNTHASAYVGLGFAEDAEVGTLLCASIFHAGVVGRLCFYTREDNGTCTLTFLGNFWNRQAKYGTAMEFELAQVLSAGQRNHTCIVRTG